MLENNLDFTEFHDNFIILFRYTKDSKKKWDKVFKNGPSEICGSQSLNCSNFLKAVFHKYHLV